MNEKTTWRFLTMEDFAQLIKNGVQSNLKQTDHYPVVKLFTPDAQATWLLTEILPYQQQVAFGLCDLGLGFPELGYVSLKELSELRGQLGLPIEKDQSFVGKKPISVYAACAKKHGKIKA